MEGGSRRVGEGWDGYVFGAYQFGELVPEFLAGVDPGEGHVQLDDVSVGGDFEDDGRFAAVVEEEPDDVLEPAAVFDELSAFGQADRDAGVAIGRGGCRRLLLGRGGDWGRGRLCDDVFRR